MRLLKSSSVVSTPSIWFSQSTFTYTYLRYSACSISPYKGHVMASCTSTLGPSNLAVDSHRQPIRLFDVRVTGGLQTDRGRPFPQTTSPNLRMDVDPLSAIPAFPDLERPPVDVLYLPFLIRVLKVEISYCKKHRPSDLAPTSHS